MFWTKCGKLIAKNNKLINCDNSPCNYYSVFGIKYRQLNNETMQPYNECNWQYSVFASEIKNSSIQWNNMYSICIPVKSKLGLVAKKKFKEGCSLYCEDYDQNWQDCIKYYQVCDFCVECEVYNLAGCFDEYNSFAQFFYEKCGRTPDSNGKYPNIFQTSYGNVYMTGEANECVENYWKKKFLYECALTFKIEFKSYEQLWEVYGRRDICDTYDVWECNCGDGYQFSYGEPCPDDCDSVYIGKWEGDLKGYGPTATRLENNRNYKDGKYDFVNIVFVPYQGAPNCCEANSIRSHISEAGDHMFSYADDEDAYNFIGSNTDSCTASNKLCFDFSYKSAAYDNYYGSYDSVRYRFSWKGIKLIKTEDTPLSAKGIKFKAKIKKIRKNEGYDVDLDEQIEETEEAILLTFGEEYKDLPFATNLTRPKYLSVFECSADCWVEESDYPHIQPFPIISWYGTGPWKHDNYTEQYQIKLIAESYF